MCASMMTFAALVSAMVVRRGLNNDWHRLPLPHILWWNTGVLILSSIAIDIARRVLRHNNATDVQLALVVPAPCSASRSWLVRSSRGRSWRVAVFISARNPSSAFFYVLTWAHAAHVVGALLPVLTWNTARCAMNWGPAAAPLWIVSAIFWHFLDVLWLGIMGLFVFWA